MKKKIFLIAVLGLININVTQGQIFHVKTLAGKVGQIHILPNESKRILKIAYFKDTIYVPEFTGIDKINVLNKMFLKIVYSVRGGAGIKLINTLVLITNGKTIYEALNITSLFNEEFIDFSKPVDTLNFVDIRSTHETSLCLTGNDINDYKLNVKAHDEQKSKNQNKDDYKTDEDDVLNFDHYRNIFYTGYQSISQYFSIYDSSTGNEIKQFIAGTFPVVKLGKKEYYYIKKEWYAKYGNHDLSKHSFKHTK